jgi:hypothetical protein
MALQVLSDAWIDGDRRLGLLLAERLQCEVTESRALALELDPGLATCDVRVLALRAPEVKALVERMAREEDLQAGLLIPAAWRHLLGVTRSCFRLPHVSHIVYTTANRSNSRGPPK